MKIIRLSASSIKTYISCPFKFYMEYHLALDSGTSFAAEQGSLVHLVFEKFGEAKRDGIENPPIESTWYDEILYAYKEEGLWKLSSKALQREKDCNNCQHYSNGNCLIAGKPVDQFDGCPKDEFEEAIWLAETVINDDSVSAPLNKKVISVEEKFEHVIPFNGEDIVVVGFMDLVTELTEDAVEITDYKTGKFQMKDAECRSDPQLLIYHLVARSKYSKYKNVFITIHYLRSGPKTFAFGPKDEAGTTEAIKRYWKAIKEDESPKRRCDKGGETEKWDHVCKYMCNIELCKKNFLDMQKNGGKILPAGERKDRQVLYGKRLIDGP